ncbi:hypothetical protein [Shigella phage ESh20]|nr:hypothetical protein [Shigella phage ESh20]
MLDSLKSLYKPLESPIKSYTGSWGVVTRENLRRGYTELYRAFKRAL